MLPEVVVYWQPQRGRRRTFLCKVFPTLQYRRNEKMSEDFSMEEECFLCCFRADLVPMSMAPGLEATVEIMAENMVLQFWVKLDCWTLGWHRVNSIETSYLIFCCLFVCSVCFFLFICFYVEVHCYCCHWVEFFPTMKLGLKSVSKAFINIVVGRK